MMGWIGVFVLHLFCGMAAIAGVHSQESLTRESVYPGLYQKFEGDAMHSIMRSWVDAGTNSSWLTDPNGPPAWSFAEHPCSKTLMSDRGLYTWEGVSCDSKLVQQNGSTLKSTNYFLTSISLGMVWSPWIGSAFAWMLVGGLPPAILNLTNLENLYIIDEIKLSGTLPPGIFCDLKDLKTLVLTNCSFNGSISNGFTPDCTENMGLEYLDLSGNSFTSLDTGDFFLLQHLNVSNNQLNGKISISGFLLEIVDFSNNFITNISFMNSNVTDVKFIYAQNNSITRFPIEILGSKALQEIYFDFNKISSLPQDFSDTNTSTIQKIFMSNNKLQLFPKWLLRLSKLEEIYLNFNNISSFPQDFLYTNISTIQKISMRNNTLQFFPKWLLRLPKLEEITLDSNNIRGELHLPNISCQDSKIKLISLLHNNISGFYPSNDPSSCFSESRILSDNKIFLEGNPICTNPSFKIKVSRIVCRFNASSPIEDEELNIVQKTNKILIIIIAIISLVVVFAFIMAFFVIQRLKKKIYVLREFQSELDKKDVKPNLYSFTELKVATQEFHSRNELGRGGFGIVYKGVLLDGSQVAVKKLIKLSMEQGIQDFLSEIITVSNIKHRNLVQLKGCCIKENQRILVHEFVENKNLADALWGDSRSNKHLDWATRFKIILGIARGLAYLHEEVEPAIIHRDIKGENILLDKDFNPKIADFGLALYFPSFDDGETHMNVSKVAGTVGYMAPEYLCYGQVSSKLDVFSFGILLLEIVSGRRNIDLKAPSSEQYLAQWAQDLLVNDNLSILRDKSLEEMTSREDSTFKQVVKVGLQCLNHIATRRPMMSEVVAMLIGNKVVDDCELEDYNEDLISSYPMEPSSFHFSIPNSSLQCLTKDSSNMVLDFESHNQSLQLSEVILLSK